MEFIDTHQIIHFFFYPPTNLYPHSFTQPLMHSLIYLLTHFHSQSRIDSLADSTGRPSNQQLTCIFNQKIVNL